MECQLSELYQKQKELDQEIAENHKITYDLTRNKRVLALLVELGEFANTTRCFKFWSNKGKEDKEVVLDEFADGLHFILSLGIDKGYIIDSISINDDETSLTETYLNTYELISIFKHTQSFMDYVKMFESYLKLLIKVGYTWEEAHEAYLKKLQVNHQRQENNY